MQALLSFEQAPPIGAPFRFLLTAPLFAMLAGGLLLFAGEEALLSRWAPQTLALTHLFTAGFMLHAMLGALIQILPVVAGANMRWPAATAAVVHALLASGVLTLVAGFLGVFDQAFSWALLLLAAALLSFFWAALDALRGVPSTSATISGIKFSLFGLAGTVLLGGLLLAILDRGWDLPLMPLTDLHAGWGLAAWGVTLLAAVSFVVVPMFQLTPAYPGGLSRWLAWALPGVASLWGVALLGGIDWLQELATVGMVWFAAVYCAVTLWLQRQSKRARPDPTQRLWQVGLLSGLVACLLWAGAHLNADLRTWPAFPLLFGVLVLVGGFVSVIAGMLYKIAPFLVWLHLQNRGKGLVIAPNMRKILPETGMVRQMRSHFAACALLLLAVLWPGFFALPAGVALIVANGWLLWNLLQTVRAYRSGLERIAQKRAEREGGGG